MENIDERDLLQEHACHRLQAALAARHGLRDFFAVTTDWRSYWDTLPLDPLSPGKDPAIPLAREAFVRDSAGPGRRTRASPGAHAQIAALVRGLAELEGDSLWRATRELHASGFALGAIQPCAAGACAFAYEQAGWLRCRKSTDEARKRARVEAQARACERFERRFLDADTCAVCGACCHGVSTAWT